jgi:hypothetical protein
VHGPTDDDAVGGGDVMGAWSLIGPIDAETRCPPAGFFGFVLVDSEAELGLPELSDHILGLIRATSGYDPPVRIALASISGMPSEFVADDGNVASILRCSDVEVIVAPWDDPTIDWDMFDLVVARSTWDYSRRLGEFCEWVRRRGCRLENDADLIVWNSDKRYVSDLIAAGLPTVETTFVAPGDPMPAIGREVVVKPTVSTGGRNTGRFGPASADGASTLIERIHAEGGTAMVQPFMDEIDAAGETAVVVIDGDVSHVLRKRSYLRPDEVAPTRDDLLGAAKAMYEPELVSAAQADRDELDLTSKALQFIADRFDTTPLACRVDMVRHQGAPTILELEAIEPSLYLAHEPGSAERLASAIVARVAQHAGQRF